MGAPTAAFGASSSGNTTSSSGDPERAVDAMFCGSSSSSGTGPAPTRGISSTVRRRGTLLVHQHRLDRPRGRVGAELHDGEHDGLLRLAEHPEHGQGRCLRHRAQPALTTGVSRAQYDVLILQWMVTIGMQNNDGVAWVFSPADLSALQTWVNNGGGLVVLSGYQCPGNGCTIYDTIGGQPGSPGGHERRYPVQ